GDAQAGGNLPLHAALAAAIASLDLARGFLPTATFRKERMRHLAAIGFATMTELADTIVREKGMSFRMAHNVVGKTVTRAVEEGKTAMDLTVAMLDDSCRELFGHPLDLSSDALAHALDPWNNIQVRKVTGGPAPEEMARMLTNARARQSAAVRRQSARRDKIAEAMRDLDQAVSQI